MADQQTAPLLTVLHYLFTASGDRVVAHCLDLDLVTSAETLEKAEEKLNAVVVAQVAICFRSGNHAQLKFQAPFKYWESLEGAKGLDPGVLEIEEPPVVLPVTRKVKVPVMRTQRLPQLHAAAACA